MAVNEKVIAVDEALKRVMDNKQLFKRLLESFTGRAMANDIISAIKQNDMELARVQTHSLKGVAANLAMNQLTAVLKQIEVAIKDEKSPQEFITNLEESLLAVENEIEIILSE